MCLSVRISSGYEALLGQLCQGYDLLWCHISLDDTQCASKQPPRRGVGREWIPLAWCFATPTPDLVIVIAFVCLFPIHTAQTFTMGPIVKLGVIVFPLLCRPLSLGEKVWFPSLKQVWWTCMVIPHMHHSKSRSIWVYQTHVIMQT